MARSLVSFLLPHPPPDVLHSSGTPSASAACSLPCSLSTSAHSIFVSFEMSQFGVVACKSKREQMDFFGDSDVMAEDDTIPEYMANMEEWMQNRPPGFGVGKVYDLSLEEKLLAEIEASKKAQEATRRNKGSKSKTTPKKSIVHEAPAGVEVWVGNLPRKRKVERDLRAVFRNAPGLLHIRPIVEPENAKTRDPVCRGFAFLTFSTEDDAYDFVERYNGEKVVFGKAEKKIACEVAKSDSPWHPKPDRSVSSAISVPKLQVRDTNPAEESRLLSAPVKKVDRELDIVTGGSLGTSFREKSFEKEEEEEDEDDEESEAELRAMEEEIWTEFEDEDDISLDLELSLEEGLDDEDEPSQFRSSMNEDEPSEPVDSGRGRITKVEATCDSGVSGGKASESFCEEDREYHVEKINSLEAKGREMERKLQLSARTCEERIARLEKRVLSKARSAVGVLSSKVEGDKKQAGRIKSPSRKKSQKPKKIGSLGSASRLKAKERAILTGVMSKYVSNSH